MWVKLDDSHKAEWQPGMWCVAALRLCESFQRELETEVARYPEQWVYFLWRPSERSLPYREPDCIGYSVGNPFDEIAESINGEPMYLLDEDECDWPALLEMIRICTDPEDWIDGLIRDNLRQKRQQARGRWLEKFGVGVQELEQGEIQKSAQPELDEEELDFGSPTLDMSEDHSDQKEAGITFDGSHLPDCSCLSSGPEYSSTNSRFVGVDTENSSSGEVSVFTCSECSRSWLRFFIEYEAFSRSGRWFFGVIPVALAQSITPERAVGVLESLEWYIRGGSYFSGKVSRASGKLPLGMYGPV